MTVMLSDAVSVARRFQRSVRIDSDLASAEGLAGFICHETGRATLQTMAGLMLDSVQRAFTWTGPYGGGKSSLALALCTFVSSDAVLRKAARSSLKTVPRLAKALPQNDEWLVVPVMGRRADPVADMDDALRAALKSKTPGRRSRKKTSDKSGRELIARLEAEAASRPESGVLVVIDEMGKFLEGAAAEGLDIHFFQELAEAANRCEGRLVVIGILHQAFEQYAFRLGSEARDDWAKVQGRYVDIPVVTATDEVIDLLGRAITTSLDHRKTIATAEGIAEAIRRRRPGTPADLATRLDRCWPLHPVTAALIGPVSRRRFGQNERSTFGFLCSGEPQGLMEFLRGTDSAGTPYYDPARLWDYLRINLEPAILASPDGHRWAQGAVAIERAEARGNPVHIRLAKTIALIDLFRNGSGVVPENAVLEACLHDVPKKVVKDALEDLDSWSIVTFRKHLDAWAIFDGSDFDIEEAVQAVLTASPEVDFERLSRLADLQAIRAKQHYYRTGTLRWFDTDIVPLSRLKDAVGSFSPKNGSAGKFVLAIPAAEDRRTKAQAACRDASNLAAVYPIAVGLPRNAWLIRELGAELIALESVRATSHELEGDGVARRELTARIAAVSAQLEEELRTSFAEATWYVNGQAKDNSDLRSLSEVVSSLADETFDHAPIIHSELINREKPSSNSQAGVRQLLYAMAGHANEQYLGIEGFPAERGLYSTVLEISGLHRKLEDGEYGFGSPEINGPGSSFVSMWQAAEDILSDADDLMPLSAIYDTWRKPPYGIRRGVLPVLAMAFIQAHRSSLAVYAEELFQPELDEYFVDRLLQNEKFIALRAVNLEGQNEQILQDVAEAVALTTGARQDLDALSVARALVRFMFNLTPWARRTSSLSSNAAALRHVMINADDPYRALFVDLPVLFDDAGEDAVGQSIADALRELASAYPGMLANLRDRMLAALGHKGDDLEPMRKRARVVSGLTGDFRLDAFAVRLADFDGSSEAMEGIASLALNKPARDWTDRDPDRAAIEIAGFALRFRQAEALARIKGREPTQHAIAVCFGTGEDGSTVSDCFNISEQEREQVEVLSEALLNLLKNTEADRRLILAALASAGAKTVDEAADEDVESEGRAAAS